MNGKKGAGIRINRPLQCATHAYLLRLSERRKNTKLMQFCNYTGLVLLPLAGRKAGCGEMLAIPSPFPAPRATFSRITREYLNFVSFSCRYSFIRAAAAPPVINWRIQSPSVEYTLSRCRENELGGTQDGSYLFAAG